MAHAPLTDSEIDTLTSYPDGEYRVRRERKIDHEELVELALDVNIEQCIGCHWWAESSEMIPDGSDDPDGHCSNCREASVE